MKSLFLFSTLTFFLAASATAAEAVYDAKKRILSADCGESRVTIQCSPKSRDCTQTKLQFTKRDGSRIEPAKPGGMKDYTAVGLACTQAKNGTPYMVIEYGELPIGCKFCEWFHLYTTEGKPLTHSIPAVLVNRALEPTQQHYPNNEDFYKLTEKLDIHISPSDPEIEYFR
jgi:hypothetical protein